MSERGRKPRKARSPREFSFDFGLEPSDEDRWTRRRSERIFLHDAAAANATPASPPPKSPPGLLPKPTRGPKAPLHAPKKEVAKAKEVKDITKVCLCLICDDKALFAARSSPRISSPLPATSSIQVLSVSLEAHILQQVSGNICSTSEPPAECAML